MVGILDTLKAILVKLIYTWMGAFWDAHLLHIVSDCDSKDCIEHGGYISYYRNCWIIPNPDKQPSSTPSELYNDIPI